MIFLNAKLVPIRPKMAILSPAYSYQYQNGNSGACPCPCPCPNSSFSIHSTSLLLTQRFPTTNRVSLSYPLRVRYPSLSLPSSTGRCLAASSEPPPPPPESDPPPDLSRVSASFSKFQDRVQIFFAVLFWMSLFFWASAFDDRSRPSKGSRFRR